MRNMYFDKEAHDNRKEMREVRAEQKQRHAEAAEAARVAAMQPKIAAYESEQQAKAEAFSRAAARAPRVKVSSHKCGAAAAFAASILENDTSATIVIKKEEWHIIGSKNGESLYLARIRDCYGTPVVSIAYSSGIMSATEKAFFSREDSPAAFDKIAEEPAEEPAEELPQTQENKMVENITNTVGKAEEFLAAHKSALRKDKTLRYWAKRVGDKCRALRTAITEYEKELAINASSDTVAAMYDALDEYHTDLLEDCHTLFSEWENYNHPEERRYSSNDWGGVRLAL